MRRSWFDFTPGKGFMALLSAVTAVELFGNGDASGVAVVGVIGLAIAAKARRGERPRRQWGVSAEAILERRLATGEISIEEFYEREAVLRNSDAKLLRAGSDRRA